MPKIPYQVTICTKCFGRTNKFFVYLYLKKSINKSLKIFVGRACFPCKILFYNPKLFDSIIKDKLKIYTEHDLGAQKRSMEILKIVKRKKEE